MSYAALPYTLLVIGNDDCDISDIITAIEKSPSLCGINEWLDFGRDFLKTPKTVRDDLRLKHMWEKVSLRGVVEELLSEWSNRTGGGTLGDLIKNFEAKQWRSYAGALVKKFSGPMDAQNTSENVRSSQPQRLSVQSPLFRSQCSHIQQNLVQLISDTRLGPDTMAILIAKNVLSSGDVSALDAIANVMERNMQLYRLIQTKPGSYEILLEAMKQTNQNGVEELLRAVYLQ